MQTSQEQSSQLEFETLVVDNDYEIAVYKDDYIIRNKKTKKILKEQISRTNGYIGYKLNNRVHGLQYIVAKQWLHNDDSENKEFVVNINRNHADNRLENLMWCDCKYFYENMLSMYNGTNYTFVRELSNKAFKVKTYCEYEFRDLWFDPQTDLFYYNNGMHYRILKHYKTKNGNVMFSVAPTLGVRTTISLNKFKFINNLI